MFPILFNYFILLENFGQDFLKFFLFFYIWSCCEQLRVNQIKHPDVVTNVLLLHNKVVKH